MLLFGYRLRFGSNVRFANVATYLALLLLNCARAQNRCHEFGSTVITKILKYTFFFTI